MKKKKTIRKASGEDNSLTKRNPADEELEKVLRDEASIEEFIKIRKLQNQVLEKMLEKISHPDKKENNPKNKNK